MSGKMSCYCFLSSRGLFRIDSLDYADSGRTNEMKSGKYIKEEIDSTGNVVTIDPPDTETIDGSFTCLLETPWKYLTIVSDGVNGLIVAKIL